MTYYAYGLVLALWPTKGLWVRPTWAFVGLYIYSEYGATSTTTKAIKLKLGGNHATCMLSKTVFLVS